MKLSEYIKQLETIESKRKTLENLINSYVKINIHTEYIEMIIIYDGADLNKANYTEDFNTVEELLKQLSAFITGAMLARHIEV